MFRNTYAEINLANLEHNVQSIIGKYHQFEYYFGVVKADCYGHGALESSAAIIRGGVNYLAVALLEEALELRPKYPEIPILCLGMVKNEDLKIAVEQRITISILSQDHLNSLDIDKLKGAKVHIKINTGMNRLGVSTQAEFDAVYAKLIQNHIDVEGIFSHIHTPADSALTQQQFRQFEQITSNLDLSKIKIVHIQASDSLVAYEKPPYVNGCRLGIMMYGFSTDPDLPLKSTFKLYSQVIQINTLAKNDTLGYGAQYRASETTKIAVLAIGYADGIIRKNTGGIVHINGRAYEIVGNICMDMLFVKVDDQVKLFDRVEIIKDKAQIEAMAKRLDTIVYEILCGISQRVPRTYINSCQTPLDVL